MHDELYIEYIRKELLGTISEVEQGELVNWKNQSLGNLQLYDNLIKAWETSSSYGSDLNIDVAGDYKIVKNKIDKLGSEKTNERRIFPFLAIAASLVILVSIFFLLNPAEHKVKTILAQVDNEKVTLPDGSVLHLSKGSQVSYKESFAQARIIQLDGSAHFSVSHDAASPFQVISPHIVTTVLGTKFLLSDDDKAEKPEVQLIEGSVSVENRTSKSKVVLKPNQTVTIEGERMEVTDFLNPTKSDWFYGALSFQDTPLVEAIAEIELRFGVEIDVDDDILNCSFSADLSGKMISQIVRAISLVYSAQIDKVEDNYHIIGGTCQ